jgi:hypothetical protein
MRKGFIVTLFMALASLVALALDGSVLVRRLHHSASLMPGDLSQFRSVAAFARHAPDAAAIAAQGLLYPPPFLLLALPLTWLPPATAYLVWGLAGTAALAAATRLVTKSYSALALGLGSSATLYCLCMGQTGEFVSALLLTALSQAQTRPIVAGIAAGCVIIKPQFALLLPLCFLAQGNWRAIGAASLTLAALCALPCLIFTPGIWQAYLTHNTNAAVSFINEPWPQLYQYPGITMFLMLRSLGLALPQAYAGQAVSSLASGFTCWWLWRRTSPIPAQSRIAATLCLAVLATPYAYTYDLTALGVALAAQAAASDWRKLLPLALFWAFTSLCVIFSVTLFLIGALVMAAIAALALSPAPRGTGTSPSPT